MSDILKFLKQKESIRREQQEMAQNALPREGIDSYQTMNSDFKLPLAQIRQAEGGSMQQFCKFYFMRLKMLKSAAREAAELKWNDDIVILDNILDIQPDMKTVIIGTLYKEQAKKPNVFQDLEGVIETNSPVDLSFGAQGLSGDQPLAGKYISEDD